MKKSAKIQMERLWKISPTFTHNDLIYKISVTNNILANCLECLGKLRIL